MVVTIKEIAQLANVSVSTVSKIINKKDSSISAETRKKVLHIVKEYNYSPYASVLAASASSTFLLGVMMDGGAEHERLLSSIIQTAGHRGYRTIVCTSLSAEEELKNLAVLASHNVDGVLWDRVAESGEEQEQLLKKSGMPYRMMDFHQEAGENNLCLDYAELGHVLTQGLLDAHHHRLLCLTDDRADAESINRFCLGFKQCLFENSISFNAAACMAWEEYKDKLSMLREYTGVVCMSKFVAMQLTQQMEMLNVRIPRELSVVSLENRAPDSLPDDGISTINLPYEQLGSFAVERLINELENKENTPAPFVGEYRFNHRHSIDNPPEMRSKKIVVVGTANMDTLISFSRMPEIGETVKAQTHILLPGGKGMNQAIGAARLGADTYLISKMGKDYDGSILHSYLKKYSVNTDGVMVDSNHMTGHAYIYIQKDGESSIAVYDGANSALTTADIDRHSELMAGASFCLLQTELPVEIVSHAAGLARKKGAKVILKPCSIAELSGDLLQHVDILVPNRKEIDTLLPQLETLEEKARYYRKQGVETVIITLGHKGCYLQNEQHSRYFTPGIFDSVDTTGAADVFIATLAVYLSQGCELTRAIEYAVFAGGLSTTWRGASTFLLDKIMLDMQFELQK